MGQYVNPGNDSFASAALYSQIYVDKTGMLKYLNQVIHSEQRYLCVSRPRRFGKSITARMIAAYYSRGCDSADLFAGYKIAEEADFRQHLNQYHVIQLDIAELKVTMPKGEDFVLYLQSCVIHELHDMYPSIVEKNACSLPLALADINEKTGDCFIIIIDEWDIIFREAKHDKKTQDEYIDLLRGLFKGEKSQRFINLAYLTGILPIKRYNSESALNNFKEYTMTSPKRLAEYVGFTQKEVKQLCEQYHMDFNEAKRWYDGYSFKSLAHVYCPNSVTNAMNEYTLIDEMPAGIGYADIVFIPRPFSDKPAMVVELKYNKSAKGAIAQIKNRQYMKSLEAYSGNILLIGVNYNKDDSNKHHTCVIEDWMKQ